MQRSSAAGLIASRWPPRIVAKHRKLAEDRTTDSALVVLKFVIEVGLLCTGDNGHPFIGSLHVYECLPMPITNMPTKQQTSTNTDMRPPKYRTSPKNGTLATGASPSIAATSPAVRRGLQQRVRQQ